MQVVDDAKRSNEHFARTFRAAHEFLKSETLIGMMEQLEAKDSVELTEQQRELQRKVGELIKGGGCNSHVGDGQSQPLDAEGGQYYQAIDENAGKLDPDFLSFSGVTEILEEVIEYHNVLSSQAKLNASTQVEFQEAAFATFAQTMESKMSSAQIQTACKLWARIRKDQTFVDTAAQVGEMDLNKKVEQDLFEFRQQTKKQESEIQTLARQLGE